MTASYPGIDLPRDRIIALLAEHRDPDADEALAMHNEDLQQM